MIFKNQTWLRQLTNVDSQAIKGLYSETNAYKCTTSTNGRIGMIQVYTVLCMLLGILLDMSYPTRASPIVTLFSVLSHRCCFSITISISIYAGHIGRTGRTKIASACHYRDSLRDYSSVHAIQARISDACRIAAKRLDPETNANHGFPMGTLPVSPPTRLPLLRLCRIDARGCAA